MRFFRENLILVGRARIIKNRTNFLSDLNEKDVPLIEKYNYDYKENLNTVLNNLRILKKYDKSSIKNIHAIIENKEVSADSFHRLPIRCHGCGSFFHIDADFKHGFLHIDIFERLKKGVVGANSVLCKSCYDQSYHNEASPIFIAKKLYKAIMSFVNRRPTLIIYIIDVTDMYGSIIDELSEIINLRKNIIFVFNKIDILPQDGNHLHALSHVQKSAESFIKKHPVTRHLKTVDTILTSFKKSIGVKKLLQTIVKTYNVGQNIIIMGGCNSGKSTFFNVFQNLLSYQNHNLPFPSVSCESPFPGTTANLIRFPITSNLILSLKSLNDENKIFPEVEKVNDFGVDQKIFEDLEINRYTENYKNKMNDYCSENINKLPLYHLSNSAYKPTTDLTSQRWLYDSPSTTTNNQLWEALSKSETKKMLFSTTIHPKTYKIPSGYSICIGNLCLCDVMSVTDELDENNQENLDKRNIKIILSVFVEHQIPCFVSPTLSVFHRLETLERQNKLIINTGDSKGVVQFPELKPHELSITGINIKRCAADICIPSLGWIGVAPPKNVMVKLRIWTRNQDVNIRTPSLVPQLIMHKGESGIMEFGRYSTHSYHFMRNVRPLTKMFENTKDCNLINKLKLEIEQIRKNEKLQCNQLNKIQLKLEKDRQYKRLEQKNTSDLGLCD